LLRAEGVGCAPTGRKSAQAESPKKSMPQNWPKCCRFGPKLETGGSASPLSRQWVDAAREAFATHCADVTQLSCKCVFVSRGQQETVLQRIHSRQARARRRGGPHGHYARTGAFTTRRPASADHNNATVSTVVVVCAQRCRARRCVHTQRLCNPCWAEF
jgi:hypothetical protein